MRVHITYNEKSNNKDNMVDTAGSKLQKQRTAIFTSQHQTMTLAWRSEIAKGNLEWQAGTKIT
jgi:hypothetical protein